MEHTFDTPAPHPCATCHLAHDSINGRYCRALSRYVQYTQPSDCPIKSNKQP